MGGQIVQGNRRRKRISCLTLNPQLIRTGQNHLDRAMEVRYWVTLVTVVSTLCLAAADGSTGVSVKEYGRTGVSVKEYSPRCCVAADCTVGLAHAKHAVVTSIRSAEYMVSFRDLQCSLRRTNPELPLIVLTVADELEPDIVSEIKAIAEYRVVPNIEYTNKVNHRFSKNWFKLNAWNLTEYAAVIMLDADTVVLGDISHLLHLPTDFAWSYRNTFTSNDNRGGVVMLRPCQEVLLHMLTMLELDETRQQDDFAEQAFFSWYFAYTGMRLPIIYNANVNSLGASGATAGGAFPLVVHFADDKLFAADESHKHWQYLCHRYHVHHRKHSPLFVHNQTD